MGQLQCVSGLTQLKSVCFFWEQEEKWLIYSMKWEGWAQREGWSEGVCFWPEHGCMMLHIDTVASHSQTYFEMMSIHTQVCFCLSIRRGSSLNTSEGVRLQCFSTHLVVSVLHSCSLIRFFSVSLFIEGSACCADVLALALSCWLWLEAVSFHVCLVFEVENSIKCSWASVFNTSVCVEFKCWANVVQLCHTVSYLCSRTARQDTLTHSLGHWALWSYSTWISEYSLYIPILH